MPNASMPDDYSLAIQHLLYLVADKDIAEELIQPVLLEFDTQEAAVQLATATARAIAAKTPHTPRTVGPLPTSHIAALVLISKARKRPAEIPDDLRAHPLNRLSDITIALLSIWRTVATAETERGLNLLKPSEQPWEALLTPEQPLGGRTDA